MGCASLIITRKSIGRPHQSVGGLFAGSTGFTHAKRPQGACAHERAAIIDSRETLPRSQSAPEVIDASSRRRLSKTHSIPLQLTALHQRSVRRPRLRLTHWPSDVSSRHPDRGRSSCPQSKTFRISSTMTASLLRRSRPATRPAESRPQLELAGINLSNADLARAVAAGSNELSDEELESVSSGTPLAALLIN